MARFLGYYWAPVDDDVARQVDLILATGANTVYVPGNALDRIPIAELRAHGVRLIADCSVFVGQELRQMFPDSVPIDAEGQPFDRDGWYVPVCPNHPQVRAWRREEITRLLDGYGHHLCGLWLDFIRFPVRWEGATPDLRPLCFCRHCLNLFLGEQRGHYSNEETRRWAHAILAERFDQWVNWKCSRIEDFVREVRSLMDSRGLATRLGIFSLPWRRDDLGGAIRVVAGQDLGRLASHVDTFSPMVYHQLCQQDVGWIAAVVRDAQAWSARAVLPIVQAMDSPAPLTPQGLADALAVALNTDTEGVMVFTLGAVEGSPGKTAAVRRSFLADKTDLTSTEQMC